MSIRDRIAEFDEELILLEPSTFDSAIVGVAERAGGLCAVCYDREKCIGVLMADNGWDREDAEEFFEFNTVGAYVGEKTPIFVFSMADISS
jgi:hypothetical protein